MAKTKIPILKAKRYIRRMEKLLEKMTMNGYIDNHQKFVASEEVSVALRKLKDSFNQNMS